MTCPVAPSNTKLQRRTRERPDFVQEIADQQAAQITALEA